MNRPLSCLLRVPPPNYSNVEYSAEAPAIRQYRPPFQNRSSLIWLNKYFSQPSISKLLSETNYHLFFAVVVFCFVLFWTGSNYKLNWSPLSQFVRVEQVGRATICQLSQLFALLDIDALKQYGSNGAIDIDLRVYRRHHDRVRCWFCLSASNAHRMNANALNMQFLGIKVAYGLRRRPELIVILWLYREVRWTLCSNSDG